jgi:hypothetical protein
MVQTTTAPEDFASISLDGRSERDDWFAQVCHRLAEIDTLKAGWDGYGSDRLPKSTLNFAAMLLANVWAEASLLSFPAIGPMSNVYVLFEALATGHTDEFHLKSDFAKISEALELSAEPVHVAVA